MPLLGRKIFNSGQPLIDVKPGEEIFTIEHTGEQFRSRSDYEKRVALYKEKTWTCQCTGHINLTHEQAWRSEQEKFDLLKRQFPEYFEKPVVEIVHHNTTILDDLVDQTWSCLQQMLAVGEPVALKVKAGGKEITGIVTRRDTTAVEMVNGSAEGECNSPSSDKENKTNSNDTLNSSYEGGSPSKWQPSRLLPHKYTIELDDSDKVICGIPACDIKRLKRTPSKDLVKLFIRSISHRPGLSPSAPWVVKEEIAKKYSLTPKFADIFMSPKMAQSSKKVAESGKKRKASLTPSGPAKKQKLDSKPKTPKKQSVLKPNTSTNSPEKTPKKSASPKKAATPKMGTPNKHKTPPKVIQLDSDSSDTSDSDSEDSSDSSDDDLTLSDIKQGKTASPKKSPKKSPKTLADLKKELANKEKEKPKNKKGADKGQPKKFRTKSANSVPKKRTGSKSDVSSPKKKMKTEPKKAMKQMTLLDLKGNKKSGSGSKQNTPKKSSSASPKKQTPVKLPPIVARLQKAQKKENKVVFYQLLAQCAKVLSARQRAALPEDIKAAVIKKHEQIAEKKKLEAMTPEQKEEYMKQKRKEIARKVQEKRLEKNKRYEDQDLKLDPLPNPKLVPTPDGLPNELFGEVAMVTEFISCYKLLLMPDDEFPIWTDSLMKSLVSGKAGFTFLTKTLEVLLQTLLQDEIAVEYSELSVPLKSIAVTRWNVSELARLCLRKHDSDDNASGFSKEYEFDDQDNEVPEELIDRLETEEIFTLRPEEKLQILTGLCNRIMGSYSVQDFMEEKQREAAELWKEKIKNLKQKNQKLKEEKEKRRSKGGVVKGRPAKKKEETEEEEKEVEKKKSLKNMTITNFYNVNSAENSATESDSGYRTSVLKSRRLAAAKAAEDRTRREREILLRRAKETEEMKMQRQRDQFEKQFAEGVALAKQVYRQAAIGTDRNHNRYWVFHDGTPGLYVEKGWAPKEIEYCVNDHFTEEEEVNKKSATPRKKGRPKRGENDGLERTYPHTGQNLWFMYDNVSDLEQLAKNLHPLGIRESVLKTKLQEHFPDLSKAVYTTNRPDDSEHSIADAEIGLADGLRIELMDIEMRLRNGGLGGVDNFTDWEKKLEGATAIKDFGDLLIETEEFIAEKFRTGLLAPIKKKVKIEVKTESGEEDEEVEEEYKEEIIVKHEKVLQLQEAIRECPTFSRLHFLMSIVDSGVKWEKSAENAKCKICKKKGDEDTLLLCDDCNLAFHMYCLRPSLTEVPSGDWFCPSCRPLTQRRCRREATNYRKLDRGTPVDSSDENDSDSEKSTSEPELTHEDSCAMCGGDEGLIRCSTCVSSFHMDCHDPPLYREPRAGTWKCMQCRSGIRLRTRTRRVAAENRRRWTKKELQSEQEEEEEESEEEEEDQDDETYDEDEDEEEKPQMKPPTRVYERSGSTSRNTRRQSQESDTDSLTSYLTSGRRSGSLRRSQDNIANSKEMQMKAVMEILDRIMKNKNSWPFLEPVDAAVVPDYYDIVNDPIDLQAMKEKCEDGVYEAAQEFVDDMALLFDNGDLYNKPESEVGKCIPVLEKIFKDLLTKHLPMCKYQRSYNRATMKSLAAHGYSDHAYC